MLDTETAVNVILWLLVIAMVPTALAFVLGVALSLVACALDARDRRRTLQRSSKRRNRGERHED